MIKTQLASFDKLGFIEFRIMEAQAKLSDLRRQIMQTLSEVQTLESCLTDVKYLYENFKIVEIKRSSAEQVISKFSKLLIQDI